MAFKGAKMRVLSLEAKEDGRSVLYRMDQDATLQFRLGPSLLGCRIDLFTNHPAKKGDEFHRERYRKLEWSHETANSQDDTAAFINLELVRAGSFRYYFTCEAEEEVAGSGFFLVDPDLVVAGRPLPLDGIRCQTVLAKNLGPISSWEDKLRVSKESGYNVIHFTPVHALGASNSAYSLADQHGLNLTFGATWPQVEAVVSKMEREWGVLSLCDIVLNHTANETKWIREHQDVTYNCANCPHLRPAFMLDQVLMKLSADIGTGKWEHRGIPKGVVNTEEHLNISKSLLYDHYLPQVNIYEYFLMDTAAVLEEFEKKIMSLDPPTNTHTDENHDKLKIVQDPRYRRMGCSVDVDLAARLYNLQKPDCDKEENRILRCSSELKRHLDRLNHDAYNAAWAHVNAGIDNVFKGAGYHRVDPNGPRTKECKEGEPIVCQYFTGPKQDKLTLADIEKSMYGQEGATYMAHNGWVMNHDPLVNFALPGSNVYLRRELVAWGDSVKLRFGDKPEDSPFLWQYMKEYAEQTARIFHGIRLDNCHSTPIHVAEYMLDAARRVRPDLYVIAELFTSSEGTDNVFINRLGINSMIREGLGAWDSHEMGRLVHRFGGLPVGSFLQPDTRPLVPGMAHALLFDQTHDNESPVEKRSVYDLLPSAALVAVASCGSGSNRGYDELVPHHIHVVHEDRTYAGAAANGVGDSTGIVRARRSLNELHGYLAEAGFCEVYVDQMDYDVVAVTRHCPATHESVVLVSHTVFSKHTDPTVARGVKPVEVEGKLIEVVLEAKVSKVREEKFEKNPKFINGMKNFELYMQEHINVTQSKMARLAHAEGSKIQIALNDFPPGSVIVFKFSLTDSQSACASHLHRTVAALRDPDSAVASQVVARLSLLDLNHVLFRCDQEERECNDGGGVYSLDGYGPMKYAGIQGVMSILSEIRARNDLGNWLPGNLRQGDWLPQYVTGRLAAKGSTKELAGWLEQEAFAPLKGMPRYLVPKYFDVIITSLYHLLLERVWCQLSPFVQNGSNFVKALALGSVQHTAVVKNASLPTLSPSLRPPAPPAESGSQMAPTVAAGLPHFSTGYMRSWGRDTFISLRGLLILTGRYQEARYIILGYAATLRHGLIPNLLDGGRNARFNCRDATWWWINCILSYVEEAPDGAELLKDKVSRLFPHDDSPPAGPGHHEQALEDVVHEAIQKHFQGLRFRERNAGRRIDEHMNDEGFNNEIGVDLDTGFVFGGNVNNCGTWMDKMGSSDKAGNKGKPSSPRDGSAVEIVGLCYASVSGLAKLHDRGLYSYGAVERATAGGQLIKWRLAEWAGKIKASFESHFFVAKGNPKDKRPDLINKTGIYKDTLNSGCPWTDYQLRCNFPIAMAVATDIFDLDHAWAALSIVKDKLLGPLGLATLDPDDWAYRGDYNNDNQSDDPTVAHGANYHQGPEWVWPVGYFLRAYLKVALLRGDKKQLELAKSFVMAVLSGHFVEVMNSHWRGIPELTNAGGRLCHGSNPIQAWSMSCLLEVMYDLESMG